MIEQPDNLTAPEQKLWGDAVASYTPAFLEDWKKDFLTLRAAGWTPDDIRAQKSPLDCLSIAQPTPSRLWTVDR
jgi:hypothetical protein